MQLTFWLALVIATGCTIYFSHRSKTISDKPEENFTENQRIGLGALIWLFVAFFSFVFLLIPVMIFDHLVTANYHYDYTQEKQWAYVGEMRSFEMVEFASVGQTEAKFAIAGYGGVHQESVKTADFTLPIEIGCQEIGSGELPHVEVFYEERHRANDSILSALTDLSASQTVKYRYVFFSPDCNKWSAWEEKVEHQA